MENILINIDTRFIDKKVFKNAGKCTYKLNNPIKNVGYVRLSSIELPTVFYEFQYAKNNTSFSLIFQSNDINNITNNDNNTNQPVIFNIVIKDGNYDSDNLITNLSDLFVINVNPNLNQHMINIKWDKVNYKTTFDCDIPFSLSFNNNDKTNHSLGRRLGFLYDNYNSSIVEISNVNENDNLIYTNTYQSTSESYLYITFDDYIFFRVNDYGTIYNDVVNYNLLAKIILPNGTFLIDNGSNFISKEQIFRKPIDINKLDIELIFPNGKTIDLNLADFSFTLEVGVIYDSELYATYESNKYKYIKNRIL